MKKRGIKHGVAILLLVAFVILALSMDGTPFPEPCNSCNGRGGATCHGCFGSGTFDTGTTRVDCSYCGGSGWLPCRPCNGTGYR